MAAAEVGDQFRDRPKVAAAIQQAIGDAYNGIGEFERSIRHLVAARELYLRLYGEGDPRTLRTE
jgi:hypothetical protein